VRFHVFEKARSSDIPRFDWRAFGWLDVNIGKTLPMDDWMFVTFSATKGERVIAKECHNGASYHIHRKLWIVAALVGIITVSIGMIMLAVHDFGPGYHWVNVLTTFEPTARNCEAVGLSNDLDACKSYLDSLPLHYEPRWQPYWIGAPLFVNSCAVLVGLIAIWFAITSVVSLVRLLKVLYSDLREIRLAPDEDVREVVAWQKVLDTFITAIRCRVDTINEWPVSNDESDDIDLMRAVHGLSDTEFEAKATQLFVERIDAEEVVEMFTNSIRKGRTSEEPTVVQQACDTAFSGFYNAVEFHVDGGKLWLANGGTLDSTALQEALTFANEHADPLVKLLVGHIHDRRADESATRVSGRFLNNL